MLKHIYLLRRKIGADAAAWSSAVTDFSQVVASCRMDATYKAFLSDLDGASGSSAGRFEWLDGPLVQAMQSGDIFLIENANLCNASVLDRLNALFEPGGKLQLTERGMVNNSIVTIAAHPDFRVVMTLDPKYGELSRAMRNRGVELALQASPVAMLPRNPVFAIQAPLLAASNASRLSLQISLETGSADLRFNPLELEYAFLSSTPSALHRNARISGTSSSLLLGNQPLLPQVARQRQSLSGNCAIHAVSLRSARSSVYLTFHFALTATRPCVGFQRWSTSTAGQPAQAESRSRRAPEGRIPGAATSERKRWAPICLITEHEQPALDTTAVLHC
jgi:hypothetical protein